MSHKNPSVGTPYSKYWKKWKDCTNCDLHRCRRNIVLGRGRIPADILLVGEAPGESEDVLGKAFAGPAGYLLDRILGEALAPLETVGKVRLAFTNLVCCIPRDEEGGKATEPHKSDIVACADRLEEFGKLVRPKLIVWVGRLAQRYGRLGLANIDAPSVDIIHPAAILRADVSQRGLAIQRTVVRLNTAAEDALS